MGLRYAPYVGQILMCDFDGFKEPEMTKKRPVIVISASRYGPKLATVVCLSTAKPFPVKEYHRIIEKEFLPKTDFFQNDESWLKGDMVYSVSYDRLEYECLGRDKNHKKVYFKQGIDRETMKDVYAKVLHGLNIGKLAKHL